MWRLVIRNPCDDDDVLCKFEVKSIQDLVKQYNSVYSNQFINYYKLDNIKRGRSERAYPYVILEKFTS